MILKYMISLYILAAFIEWQILISYEARVIVLTLSVIMALLRAISDLRKKPTNQEM